MEFRARYELIGLFSLAVIAALFAFVFWINNKGGFGERAEYRVRFSVPVSGLAIGGGVNFNGIRVGEVLNLSLDRAEPGQIEALISIDKTTPVRADTLVGVDYQGLTGVANILLTGGSPSAGPLTAMPGQPPLLIADPAASRSWTQSAGRVLASIDDLIGRNSNRVDGILAGLERMTGGGAAGKGSAPLYDLPAPADFKLSGKTPTYQLVVSEPSVPLALNTDKLQQQRQPGEMRALDDVRFADNLPNLIQTRLIQAYENAGYLNAVLRPADAADPDYKLLLDIRTFALVTSGEPEAVFEFVAKLVDREGKVVAARPVKASVPAASVAPGDAVAALGQAFGIGAREVIEWTGAAL